MRPKTPAEALMCAGLAQFRKLSWIAAMIATPTHRLTLERHQGAPPARLATNADGIAARPCGVALPGDG
jgi:hypothetical protein